MLDNRIAAAVTARVDAAHRRIDTGRTPALGEFDAIRGLTGLGAHWLRRDPDGPCLRRILGYLVRLTEPGPVRDGPALPGWWTHVAPDGRPSAGFPDGHANHGLSHGIAGPLALLALAARAENRVPGHTAAIERILAWLDTHERRNDEHVWWPYWTTTPEPGATDDARPGRPSWCYGVPGIARAQQLAGLALDEPARVRAAETALLTAITAPDLAARLDDPGLCHGLAGALLLTRRAAADSADHHLREQSERLRRLVEADPPAVLSTSGTALGLLDGPVGATLALGDHTNPGQGWDACLLTS